MTDRVSEYGSVSDIQLGGAQQEAVHADEVDLLAERSRSTQSLITCGVESFQQVPEVVRNCVSFRLKRILGDCGALVFQECGSKGGSVVRVEVHYEAVGHFDEPTRGSLPQTHQTLELRSVQLHHVQFVVESRYDVLYSAQRLQFELFLFGGTRGFEEVEHRRVVFAAFLDQVSHPDQIHLTQGASLEVEEQLICRDALMCLLTDVLKLLWWLPRLSM